MGRKRKRKKPAVSPLPVAKTNPPNEPSGTSSTVWLAPVIAVALILTSGVIYGLQTNRWSTVEDVEIAASRLQDVPMAIGDWTGRDIPISDRQLKMAGAVGYVNREYRNQVDGRRVYLMVLCGAHGPISLHPPTVCFTGAGWRTQQVDRTEVKTAESDGLGRFQVGRFRRQATDGTRQMVTFWAWNANGDWKCPERPRFAFAGSPHLYKLYVGTTAPVSENDKTPEGRQKDLCVEFMRLLLPRLKKIGV